jgi:uncharacterized membrane protein
MEAHLVAGFGYFFTPILPLIFFFMEKNNKFVKFHALQSIILGVAEVVVFILVFIVQFVILAGSVAADNATGGSGIFASGGLLTTCLLPCVIGILSLGFLGLWLWGMISGFTGKATKLPVIGNLAEKWAGGAPTPVM